MYHDFYELNENPFNVTADPDFFFSSHSHSEAISLLNYGILLRKGIMVLTGEIGTGKTTLCRRLLQQKFHKTKFALLLNPIFSELELLQMIVRDFGIITFYQNKLSLLNRLNQYLIKESKRGNNVVLIIDESQNLSVNQLEYIRLLSNFETQKHKLLQVILVGQPELSEKLKLPALKQLLQRIAIHYHIKPLEKDDIQKYIYHRLAKVMKNPNAARYVIFSEQAIELIYRYSQGAPRMINIICDRALLAGFVAGSYSINGNMVEHCVQEILYCEHYL